MSKANEVLGLLSEGKIEDIKFFDWKETEKMCAYYAKWIKKRFKVFEFDLGSDDYLLVVAKSKPSPKDVAAAAPPGQLVLKDIKYSGEFDPDEHCEED